jgi:hypothetical protein
VELCGVVQSTAQLPAKGQNRPIRGLTSARALHPARSGNTNHRKRVLFEVPIIQCNISLIALDTIRVLVDQQTAISKMLRYMMLPPIAVLANSKIVNPKVASAFSDYRQKARQRWILKRENPRQ